MHEMDTLGIEPKAFRMRSGCDTTTPCARLTRLRAKRGGGKLKSWSRTAWRGAWQQPLRQGWQVEVGGAGGGTELQ